MLLGSILTRAKNTYSVDGSVRNQILSLILPRSRKLTQTLCVDALDTLADGVLGLLGKQARSSEHDASTHV